MARQKFYTDRADEYPCGGCPECRQGIIRLTLDSLVDQQWAYCFSCGHEIPASFDWAHYGENNKAITVDTLTVGAAWPERALSPPTAPAAMIRIAATPISFSAAWLMSLLKSYPAKPSGTSHPALGLMRLQ